MKKKKIFMRYRIHKHPEATAYKFGFVYWYPEIPGLAIRRQGNRWTIFHLFSGLSVRAAWLFRDLKTAESVLIRLKEIDWDFTEKEAAKNKVAGQLVKRIEREVDDAHLL